MSREAGEPDRNVAGSKEKALGFCVSRAVGLGLQPSLWPAAQAWVGGERCSLREYAAPGETRIRHESF